ncbi:PadR family transcriptional regulator [Kineosporia sp. J2-2]|uniref:PadR family transcriptional regulator n=1 Tax=Kineosporia corallincola TaxID=2835133 RepID=A0ABS5TQU2_9ACTN|nr:PadR family transcriptional regulator [Kineosporia corallincola]MBT0772663.1 PadR family transcriptional regulator [Kineosporia corallincola]
MSVRQSLLAILAEGEQYGYQLRHEFELRTGRTWPINIGQVYTTLNRLVRDGLVEEAGRQDDGSVNYRLTFAGREEVEKWWATAVDRGAPNRDEVAIKVALAATAPGVDVIDVVSRQKAETLRVLQGYTRQKRALPEPSTGEDLARLLVLDSLIFAAEAEARWLDLVGQRLTAR